MFLYHGTKESFGKSIIKDGAIKSNISRNYDLNVAQDYKTTDGYVYLTNNLSKACYYGNKNCFIFKDQKPEDYYYIFRLEIYDEKELLPDRDELRAYSLDIDSDLNESLKKCMSATIKQDINLKKYQASYVIVPSVICRENEEKLKFILKSDFFTMYQIESRDNLNEYQNTYIKESYEQFDKLFKWIPIE
jgi:hypothetical protein